MNRRKIIKIIEPQFSSEKGGIRWFRSLTPADAKIARPFLALEYFQSNQLAFDKPQPSSRHYQGVKLFSHIIRGNYSVRINKSQVFQAGAGDFIEIDTGAGAQLEEVYLTDQEKIEGFRLWIDQNSLQNPGINVSIHARNEKQLRFQQGRVQIQFFSDFYSDQKDNLFWTDSDLRILDVNVLANTKFEMNTTPEQQLLAFVYQGRGYFGPYQDIDDILISRQCVLLFDNGQTIQIQTKDTPISLLVVTAKPFGEDIPSGTMHSKYNGSILKIDPYQ